MANTIDTRTIAYERRYEEHGLCAHCDEKATHEVATSTTQRREDNGTFYLHYGTCSGHIGQAGNPAYLTPDL